MRSIRPAFWIAGAVLVAAAIILVIHLSANTMEFSRYNYDWNGTSSFFSDLNRNQYTEIYDPGKLSGYHNNTILLIIAPRYPPTAAELAGYQAFLNNGNTIFLADHFGTGNEILAGIGSSISILPGTVESLDQAYPDPYTIVAYCTSAESPVPLPEDLSLNNAAPLNGGSPLILSSVLSWNDIIGDRRLHYGEDMGTFPIMATEPLDGGQLIVISDPNIFINSMYSPEENGNNRYFIRQITDRNGMVLIDQMNSRTADASGFSEILHVIRTTAILEISIVCLLMLGAAWAWKKQTM